MFVSVKKRKPAVTPHHLGRSTDAEVLKWIQANVDFVIDALTPRVTDQVVSECGDDWDKWDALLDKLIEKSSNGSSDGATLFAKYPTSAYANFYTGIYEICVSTRKQVPRVLIRELSLVFKAVFKKHRKHLADFQVSEDQERSCTDIFLRQYANKTLQLRCAITFIDHACDYYNRFYNQLRDKSDPTHIRVSQVAENARREVFEPFHGRLRGGRLLQKAYQVFGFLKKGPSLTPSVPYLPRSLLKAVSKTLVSSRNKPDEVSKSEVERRSGRRSK